MTLCNYQPFISSSQNLGGINWSKTNLVQVRSPKLCICTNDLTNAMLPISAAICSTLFPWLSLEYAVLGALLMRSITILYNNSHCGKDPRMNLLIIILPHTWQYHILQQHVKELIHLYFSSPNNWYSLQQEPLQNISDFNNTMQYKLAGTLPILTFSIS